MSKWLLEGPVLENLLKDIVTDSIEKNSKFQYDSGMRPKVVRRSTGHCCEWCDKMAGTYYYPDVPKDVYRRHNNCNCTVEYDPGDGRRQDIWTKKWREDKEILDRRKKVGLDKPLKKNPKDIENSIENDIIKKNKYAPVETIDEAIEYLKTLGISTSYDYKSVNLDVANMINKEITDMYDTFGNLHEMGVLNEIFIVTGKKSWYAAYQRQTGMLMLSKNNVSRTTALKKLKEDAKRSKELGFWSTGEAEHSIRHELGHAVDYAYIRDNGVLNNPKADKITILNNKTMDECGINRWSMSDREHFKIAGEKLSYYGLMNDKEFVAESIAEYISGKPREISRQVVDILLDRE